MSMSRVSVQHSSSALEWGRHKIIVNAYAPGMVYSNVVFAMTLPVAAVAGAIKTPMRSFFFYFNYRPYLMTSSRIGQPYPSRHLC